MNKAQLIDALAERLGDRKTAAAAVTGLVDVVIRTVNQGDKVTITGFGVFEQRPRAARMARNPRTGEPVQVKKTTVPAFRPGTHFRAVIGGTRPLLHTGTSLNGAHPPGPGTRNGAVAASEPAVEPASEPAVTPPPEAGKPNKPKKAAAKDLKAVQPAAAEKPTSDKAPKKENPKKGTKATKGLRAVKETKLAKETRSARETEPVKSEKIKPEKLKKAPKPVKVTKPGRAAKASEPVEPAKSSKPKKSAKKIVGVAQDMSGTVPRKAVKKAARK